jgi:drug/metabolite transporter (DMT)-like permease
MERCTSYLDPCTVTTPTRKGSLLILTAALLWSTGGLFIKSISMDAFGVSFWRSSFAVLTLYLVYNRSQHKIAHHEDESWFNSHTLLAALSYSALLILFVVATKLTTSANAIFLQFTAPIYVLFLEPLLTRTKIKRDDIITVCIAIAAMALFFIGKFDTRSVWGNIAALTSGIFFAGYALMLKHDRASEATRWRIVIVGHVIIMIAMVVYSVITGQSIMPNNANDLLMVAFLGIVQIGIAYSLFTFGLSHVRALDALLLSMLEPVLNPVWVFLGLGERPSIYAIMGGAIILALVALRAIRGERSAAAA